jgi:hypothetical protein
MKHHVAITAVRNSGAVICHKDRSRFAPRIRRAPDAGALHHVLLTLGVRFVLGSLEIIQILPTRLCAAESFPIEFNVEAFGSEIAFLHGYKVVEAHALRRNLHPSQLCGHGEILGRFHR